MTRVRAKVSETGQVELPAKFREELGLRDGETVVIWVEDGEIRIRQLDDALSRIQEEVRRLGGERLSVDDFLATRLRDTGE